MNLLMFFLMAQPGGSGNAFSTLIMLALIIIIFYFFMIRPQVKKQKEVRQFRESLKKGDKVLTMGGIYGKITEVADTYVFLEIDDNVKIKVDKAGIIKDPGSLETAK